MALGTFQLRIHLAMRLEPPWRAVGLGPPVGRSKERMLELHSMQGLVTPVSVRSDLVDAVLTAAREAGLEVITEPEALKTLKDDSARLERLRDIALQLPHVPWPALRAELSAALPGMPDEVL